MAEFDFVKNPLARAVCEGDADAVRNLAAAGGLDEVDPYVGTPLAAAVTQRDAAMVDLLLQLGADPNFVARGRSSLLSDAALQKHLPIVQSLLAAGADPNLERDGDTPLIAALTAEHLGVVKALVAAGADLFRPNKYRQTALLVARACKSRPLAEFVEQTARDAAAQVGLLDAVRVDALDRIRELLQAGPSPELLLEAAFTAVDEGGAEALRLLLGGGVDPNARRPASAEADAGVTLLIHAVKKGRDPVVDALLAAGADPNATAVVDGVAGTTALRAAAHGKLSLIRKLAAAGADPSLRDAAGDTPLAAAQALGKAPVIRYLQSLAADRVAADGAGPQTLHEAVRDGLVDSARAMLDAGADPTARDASKARPLELALEAGRADLVRLLLDRGADWSAAAHDGVSIWRRAMRSRAAAEAAPLLLAAAGGRRRLLLGPKATEEQTGWLWSDAVCSEAAAALAALLLEAGLDPNAKLEDGDTPLSLAIRWNGRDVVTVVQRLLAAGADAKGEYKDHGLRAGRAPVSLLELAKRSSKKAYAFLREHLQAPADVYDRAEEELHGLAKAANHPRFQELVRRVGKTLKAPPQAWKKRVGTVHFRAKLDRLFPSSGEGGFVPAVHRVENLQTQARRAGATLLYVGPPADEGEATSLVLLPTDSWAVALRATGPSGPNYGVTCRDVVDRLGDWAETHPFDVLGAGPDFVDLRFREPVDSWKELYEALCRLCPDFRDDECAESEIAAFFRQDRRCFLWWD